jgi:hypothetical protein
LDVLCRRQEKAVPTKPIVWTLHAQVRRQSRQLRPEWIEAAIRSPDWTEPDPYDSAIERRFRAIDDFGGRIMRVACVETDTNIRIISVMFDRTARRKP